MLNLEAEMKLELAISAVLIIRATQVATKLPHRCFWICRVLHKKPIELSDVSTTLWSFQPFLDHLWVILYVLSREFKAIKITSVEMFQFIQLTKRFKCFHLRLAGARRKFSRSISAQIFTNLSTAISWASSTVARANSLWSFNNKKPQIYSLFLRSLVETSNSYCKEKLKKLSGKWTFLLLFTIWD